MTVNSTHRAYHEWSRYEWAGVDPIPAEPDVPRWNLAEWPGDLGDGQPEVLRNPADMAEGEVGISGFRHNPGGGSRWAQGYRH